jgi:uncharacterized protein
MRAAADRFSRIAALRPVQASAKPAKLRAPDQEDFLCRLLGAAIATNKYGEHVCVRNWYSSPETVEPSAVALKLLCGLRDAANSSRAQAALSDPAKWLFLDTETTGLAGGTGTYAFLVGMAWWDAGGMQLEQLFLRDFAEEHSILHEVALRLAERPVLVTFNGKTFDWPLLENRFTMTRTIATPRLAAHIDLVHPARALWRMRLGSARLVDLERHVLDPVRLGWCREDDVASTVIPQQYFDFLRGGPVEPLVAILRHNQMDLRGLAALFGKMNALLSDCQYAGELDGLDLFGLSRFLRKRGEHQRAQVTCSRAIDSGLPFEFDRQARCELALSAKRRGEHEVAAALWKELTKDADAGPQACEELAIYYERRGKDCERALEFAKLGLIKLRRAPAGFAKPFDTAGRLRREGRLGKKVRRLEGKIARRRSLFSGDSKRIANQASA